jgi:putative nucleotidyltransferase with HDIG domain
MADWFGDDRAFRRKSYDVDWSGLPYRRLLVTHAGRGHAPRERLARATAMLANPRANVRRLMQSHCSSATQLARQAGLGEDVCAALDFTFERWDGGGLPRGASGAEIPIEMRIIHVAEVAEVYLARDGVAGALEMARARRGKQFDPAVVAALEACVEELTAACADPDAWRAALDLAPDRGRPLTDSELDQVVEAMSDFADLKAPRLAGHSRAVAALAAKAADRLGLDEAQTRVVRRAGLLHDIGRMGVSNGIWEKAGPLTQSERERVRLYPYLTRRVLDRVPALQAVAAVAGAHQERLDGSGYPHGLAAVSLSPAQRVLAAADVYCGLIEDRHYRPALAATDAAARLQDEARSGKLDTQAVRAVLSAAGEPVPRRHSWPDGLTAREVDVLRLLARGYGNAAIAAGLHIAEKTVRNHVEHIYRKIDVNNRTGASLYALRHGILPTPHGH